MNEVKKSDVEFIVRSLRNFLNHVIETNSFSLQEFFDFMEPKFTEAGYRKQSKVNLQEQEYQYRSNILIIAGPGNGMGDFIQMVPAIREIRRIYPKAHITLIIHSRFLAFASICPYVDELIVKKKQEQFPFSLEEDLNIVPNLLEQRFDIAFSLTHFAELSLLMYMSGARSRVICSNFEEKEYEVEFISSRYFANLATNIAPARKYGNHVTDIFLSVVDDTLLAPVSNRNLEVWYTPEDFSFAKSIIKNLSKPLYVLMLGASGFVRHYPPEKYAKLLEMILSEEPSATFLILGGGQLDVMSTQILKQNLEEKLFSEHVIDLVGKTNFRIDAAILSFCDIYIGNNTGSMAVATAVKCPVLVVECFPKDLDSGVTDIPRLYSPYRVPSVSVQPKHALPECAVNKPYNQYGCRANRPHCITQIEPETIFKGFHILKDKIVKKINTNDFIC